MIVTRCTLNVLVTCPSEVTGSCSAAWTSMSGGRFVDDPHPLPLHHLGPSEALPMAYAWSVGGPVVFAQGRRAFLLCYVALCGVVAARVARVLLVCT